MFAREDPRLLRLFPVHPEDVHLVVEEHLELLEGDHRAGLHLHPFDLQGSYIAISTFCTFCFTFEYFCVCVNIQI